MPRIKNPAASMALRHYLQQIWKERNVAIPGLLLPGFGVIFTTYIPPLIIAAVIKRFASSHPDLHAILPYLGWFALAWLSGEALWRIAFLAMCRAQVRSMNNLYVNGMNELFKKDISFFHDNFAGALTKKVVGYGRSYEGFFDAFSFNVFAALLPLIFTAFILWQYSPWLVVILLAMMAFIISIVIPLTLRRKKLVVAREAASNKMAGHIADVIGNIDTVQAFGREDVEAKRHRALTGEYMDKALKSWDYHTMRIDMAIAPFYVLTNVVGLAAAIVFSKDSASLAAIFVTFNYYAYTTRELWEFNRTYRNLENALTEAGQFTELLVEKPKLTEVASPIQFNVRKGYIDFNDVTFAYQDNEQDALFENFNLHIKAGEKIALVGHSGGGKTTITKMLLRFVDINAGELLIDRQSIARARLKDLRNKIAYVPQEPAMFHRSIKENIRYGRLDATDEEVYEAAKKAHAHEFIGNLPQGYDTLVGERGVKLSGGQRQRIAIARAILKDAPILVLDEATSALDSESELLIQDALWKLMQNRTAIVIAHRLSTIQKMDRIIVLENGSIAEQGSHKQLIEQKGIYAKLWAHQSGGFIED